MGSIASIMQCKKVFKKREMTSPLKLVWHLIYYYNLVAETVTVYKQQYFGWGGEGIVQDFLYTFVVAFPSVIRMVLICWTLLKCLHLINVITQRCQFSFRMHNTTVEQSRQDLSNDGASSWKFVCDFRHPWLNAQAVIWSISQHRWLVLPCDIEQFFVGLFD